MTGIGVMLCLVVIPVVLAKKAATDYCNPKLCPHKTHTMCKYESGKPAKACGEFLKAGCTNDDKNVILKLHNDLRRDVASGRVNRQPKADFMPDLVWDDELALIAQRWVNQCKEGKDECYNVGRFNVGQNMANDVGKKGESPSTLQDLIYSWFGEFKSFDTNEVPKYTGKNSTKVGHYTQLVWADTKNLGCGCIWFQRHDGSKVTHLACNYGPSGNVKGKPIYKIKT